MVKNFFNVRWEFIIRARRVTILGELLKDPAGTKMPEIGARWGGGRAVTRNPLMSDVRNKSADRGSGEPCQSDLWPEASKTARERGKTIWDCLLGCLLCRSGKIPHLMGKT